MPIAVENCVSNLLAKWKKDPGKCPKTFTSGSDKGKPVETAKDRKKLAWAICQRGVQAYHDVDESEDVIKLAMVEGAGPTMLGVAAVNDPHILGMSPLEVVVRKSKELIKAQVLRFGVFRHPKVKDGKLVISPDLYTHLIQNFKEKVLGRKPFFDEAHEPNKGSLGEIVELEQHGDGLFAIIDPTKRGLEVVKERLQNYASIWMHLNWKGTELKMSFSEAEEEDVVKMALQEAKKLQEESMLEKDKTTQTLDASADTEAIELAREELKQAKEEVLALKAQYKSELETTEKQNKLLQDAVELARLERTQRIEELRLEKVDLLVESLSKPDEKGHMLIKPVLELGRAALRGDPIGEGEQEIKLSAESTREDEISFYHEAIERLLRLTPRTVPTSRGGIEPHDHRPPNGSQVDLQLRRGNLIDIAMDQWQMSREEAGKRADEVLATAEEMSHA